jgi:hypothetical protein
MTESASASLTLTHEGQSLIETLAETITDFSVQKIPVVLPLLMKQANTYKTLSMVQKKSMVINMLKHLIYITDGPGDDAIWDPILTHLLPGIIDLLVESNNGKLVLKKSKSIWAKLSPCCHKESSPEDTISQSPASANEASSTISSSAII